MNLKEKAQKVAEKRSYEQITNDAEKYLVAAAKVLDGENPGEEFHKIGFGGTDDFTHVHILVNDESKVTINRAGDNVAITLDETDETVNLNEKDSAEVIELILNKLAAEVAEREKGGCPAGRIIGRMLVVPLVFDDLRKAGRDPQDVTPRELNELIEKKIEEIMNSED